VKIISATEDGLREAVSVLKKGGIVAHATETCYGLACDFTNPDARAKIFRLKKRPSKLPVSVLVSSIEQARRYVEWNETAQELARMYWPGPLTLVLRSRDPIYGETIGLRISSHPIACALVKKFGKPITSTSANLHGKSDPYDVSDIELEPDLTLDSGKLPKNPPSTVIHIDGVNYSVLREGAISL